MMPAPVIEQITPFHPKAVALLHAASEATRALYPPSSQHGIAADQAAEGVMLAAWVDGEAVACGVLLPNDADVAEVKRLYVMPEHRRLGLARKLMADLEMMALRLGHDTIRLETGKLQPAAIGLYQRIGYSRIAPFGEYADDPMSVCFEKKLSPTP